METYSRYRRERETTDCVPLRLYRRQNEYNFASESPEELEHKKRR